MKITPKVKLSEKGQVILGSLQKAVTQARKEMPLGSVRRSLAGRRTSDDWRGCAEGIRKSCQSTDQVTVQVVKL